MNDKNKILQQKLDKITELHKGISILTQRMNDSKKDLFTYFDQNPQLKNGKYLSNNCNVRYIERKVTDGISQKLLVSGLTQYFKIKQLTDQQISKEVTHILQTVKNQRQTKISPNIDIKIINE